MTICQRIKLLLIVLLWSGCAFWDNGPANKLTSTGLIATPPSYYSTVKARYLGTTYKDNLDRLTERIARNSSTAELQFANNISSVGGIGFFTHSATKTVDERYLEVVLATPETFQTKGEYSEKVNGLFSRYGQELLGILAGDMQIYQDRELTGYGLNLTWRNAVAEPPSNRVNLARAIIYFQKDRVSKFLARQISQQDLLSDAVIFAMEEDGPLNLVSYQRRENTADFRPAIREDNLAVATTEANQSTLPLSADLSKGTVQRNAAKVEPAKKQAVVAEAKPRDDANKPIPVAEKPEAKEPIAAAQKLQAPLAPREGLNFAGEKLLPAKRDAAVEQLALTEPPAKVPPATISPEVETPESTSLPEREPAVKETVAVTGKVNEPTVSRFSAPTEKREAPRQEEIQANTASGQIKKIEPALEPTKPTEKVAPPVLASKRSPEVKTKTIEEIKKQESVQPPAAFAPLPAFGAAVDETSSAPVAVASKLENRSPVMERSAVPLAPERRQNENTSTSVSPTTLEPKAKTSKDAQPRADLVAPADAKRADSAVASSPAAKAAVPIITPEPAKSLAIKKGEATPGRRTAEKLPNTAPAGKIEPLVSEVAKVPEIKLPAASGMSTTTPETAALRKIETPTIAKPPEGKAPVPAIPLSAEKTAEVAPARKVETPNPVMVAKVEPQTSMPAPMPSIAATVPEKVADKSVPEQLALLRKPPEPTIEKKPLVRQTPRALEGFIIQIAFNDKGKAQIWAEKMEQRGYAVSVTEAGSEGVLRVRVGNFSIRDEAERQLRNFKQDGMNGIIINLPQAFRPEARVSVP